MENKKISIAILFGGKSPEHDISVQSAKNIFEAIDKKKYNIILIGIDKKGKWILQNNDVFNTDNIRINQYGDLIVLVPQDEYFLFNLTKKEKLSTIDIIFPILHGPFGEDGTIQGLLALSNIPFIGAKVLGSAIGMDKDIMKRLLKNAGIPVNNFIVLKKENKIPDITEIKQILGFPFFIKPANMGSSIGVSKIDDESKYLDSIHDAFTHDKKILIEQYIKGRELECAVIGIPHLEASIVGEIIPTHTFYSYESKYTDEKGAILKIPADIDLEKTKQIQELSIKTFKTLECEGLGRVDFFLKENGDLLVNEINTIPGFTKNSMYPKLWEASGIPYTELIDRLIGLYIK